MVMGQPLLFYNHTMANDICKQLQGALYSEVWNMYYYDMRYFYLTPMARHARLKCQTALLGTS